MKMLLAILVLMLAACSPTSPVATADHMVVSGSWGEAEVQMITLADGTHCAVLIGAGKGAISCNWK